MAHITFSLPLEVFQVIKRHPEIKWTELVRQAIVAYANQIEGVMTCEELKLRLGQQVVADIEALDEGASKKLYRKMVEEEWKHVK